MSAIFGIVSFDGSVTDLGPFRAMSDRLQSWGRDRRAYQHVGTCAFGQYLLFATPEARHEDLPRVLGEPEVVFTAAARLDNRADLARELGIDAATLAITSDGDLALQAFLRWDRECPSHLLGDWTLAAWTPRTRRLFLARDHLGNGSVMFHADSVERPRRLAFAPTRGALHAAGAPARVNDLHLAQLLISWPAYQCASTIDLDIQRLPPGHALVADPDGITSWQYWFPAPRADLLRISTSDAVAEFRRLYADAVASRCRHAGGVAATLSGGLDSGSVTLLAADVLQERGERLLAMTHVPRFDCTGALGSGRFGDESEFAALTASAAPNIDHVRLASTAIHPLDGIDQALAILDEPTHAGSNAFWIYDLMQHAQRAGSRVLLTGQGGNATVSWTGAPEFDSLLAYWRHRGTRQLVKRLLPDPLARYLLRAHRRRHQFPRSSISPELIRRTNLVERLADAHGRDPTLGDNARSALAKRLAVVNPGQTTIGDLWSANGAAFGLSVRDPTCDVRVVEYTLALPDRVFRGPQGEDRWLIRTAMAGLMPDAVRLNQARGRQSADLVQRLRQDPQRLSTALDSLKGTPAELYVSLDRLRDAWARIQSRNDAATNHLAVSILLRGLNAALWINRQ